MEYNRNNIWVDFNTIEEDHNKVKHIAKLFITKMVDKVPTMILNGSLEVKKAFLDVIKDNITLENGYTKTSVAGVNYIKHCIE